MKPEVSPPSRAQASTRWVFAVAGAVLAAWAPIVPLTKARLGLDDAGLGALLLCVGLGALATMPFTGALAARLGFRRVILCATCVGVLVFPALALIQSTTLMALALLCFGAAMGMLDVGMNLLAATVERESGRPMMSGFHARWSIGTIMGAGAVTGMLGLGLTPTVAATVVSVACLAVQMRAVRGLPDQAAVEKHPLFVMPRGSVFVIGFLCLVVYLVEHSVLDWSAVYLVSEAGAGVGMAGLGYTAFAAAMTLARLVGDPTRAALGDGRVLMFGGLMSALGLSLVVLWPSVYVCVLGYAVLGAGAANIVPVLFSVAGRTRVMSPTLALTAVATFSHLGALGGPALIGFVVQEAGLKVAFGMLAAGMLAVSMGRQVMRLDEEPV